MSNSANSNNRNSHYTKLPSLVIGYGKKKKLTVMSPEQYLTSIPISRRERTNLLFEDALEDNVRSVPTGFSRNGLRTPPHIRRAIEEAISAYAGSKTAAASITSSIACSIEEGIDGTLALRNTPSNDSKNTKRNINQHNIDWTVENKLAKERTSKYLLTPEEKAIKNPSLYQALYSSSSSPQEAQGKEMTTALSNAVLSSNSSSSVVENDLEIENKFHEYFSPKP